MLICQVCKKQFRQITSSHTKTHGLSLSQYVDTYPNSPVITDELRHAYGKYFREDNPMNDPTKKRIVIEALTGRPKSEKHKRALSESKKGKSWGTHTEEHKEYMAEVSRENMLKRLADGWSRPKWSDERREHMKVVMSGNKNGINGHHNKGQTLDLSDDQRKNRSFKRSEFIRNNKTQSSNTSIEISCMAFLTEQNISFVQQYPIEGKTNVWLFDFYIPERNLLIEVDEEYWHSTKKQFNRDILKTQTALKLGFSVLRLSDSNLDFSIILESDAHIKLHTDNVLSKRLKNLK